MDSATDDATAAGGQEPGEGSTRDGDSQDEDGGGGHGRSSALSNGMQSIYTLTSKSQSHHGMAQSPSRDYECVRIELQKFQPPPHCHSKPTVVYLCCNAARLIVAASDFRF